MTPIGTECSTGWNLTSVLQAGKYLTGQAATWSEGDWNEDGGFDSRDIVTALAGGRYEGPWQSALKDDVLESVFAEV